MTDADGLIREAEALGIPWKEILEAELRTERVLRPFLDSTPEPPSLERMLGLLPMTALESWRVRRSIQQLAWQSLPGSGDSTTARRELRTLSAWLRGHSRKTPATAVLAAHFLLAYRRVQELVALRRRAASFHGTREERLEALETSSGCGAGNGRWAVQAEIERKTRRLDDAVKRAREDGFEIPEGPTELEAFLRLRRFLGRRGLLAQRANGRRGRPPSVSAEPA